jgi:urea transport system permease protein
MPAPSTPFAFRKHLGWCLLLLGALWSAAAHALSPEDAWALAEGDNATRIEALNRLALSDSQRAHELIRALAREAVQVQGQQVLIVDNGRWIDAATGAAVDGTGAVAVMLNNRMRNALEQTLAVLDLFDPDPARQQAAAQRLRESQLTRPDPALAAQIERALLPPYGQRLVAPARLALEQAQAVVWLGSADATQRLAAAQVLAELAQPLVRNRLAEQLELEADPAVQQALRDAVASIDRTLALAEVVRQVFTGLSLGSILLLVALGLAITYGLLGVINMAHGELIMIGAYATFMVHVLFQQFLPGWFDWYLLAALPVAFLAAALVGALMERGVIRWLYGRPLETLLATWGISLILIQLVRSTFGAQNVAVVSPQWMSGGVEVMSGLTLPWNRIFIIAFAAAVVIGVALFIGRTRMGLFVRGVTQNRPMAACMGVNTARVDTLAFAFGSGIAGLAGVAVSQIGNVAPDLGQQYIIDSFMVVVLGGVGQLAGTVYAAMGLGVVNKFIEGWAGAVLAKIAVLVLIILIIQKRPQGLFALKGRTA